MTTELPADLDALEQALLERVGALRPSATSPVGVDPLTAATLLEAEVTSRLVDHTARWLRAEHGAGYYTIGSAGHEANAAIALALRPTDPALLHYRSGGFFMARSMQARQHGIAVGDPVVDVLRGMLARTTDPISGGRHKVFGSHPLSIIPQTSTIASHLPRAVGLALSFGIGERDEHVWPADSVVVCSFGDASLNHSTAQGAINWAGQSAHAGKRVPLLFVCEDNGIGLSVPSPNGWVAESTARRAGIRSIRVDGSDPAAALPRLDDFVDTVRADGAPGLIHLDTVRFLGHAGTDVETAYRTPAELTADRLRDPLVGATRLAIDAGTCTGGEFVEWYLDLRDTIRATALEVRAEPEFATAAEVMRPLRSGPAALPPPTPADLVLQVTRPVEPVTSRSEPHRDLDGEELTLARTINRMLSEVLADDDSTLVFGEDVGRKGGVYGVTRGLQQRFGAARVFDTLLDEQSILGLALGASLNGFLPIPEIQYLAYLHNAEDQIRGEAATLGFFSDRQYANPMVIRIASYGYQKGFGGHFHNDNSIAVLRDIPGIVIASPAHPSDAAGMLAACVAEAESNGTVCAFLEPIARYHDTDLHDAGDSGWLAPFDPTPTPLGRARTWGDGDDLTIITWGNGLLLSLQAQRRLADDHGVSARVVDLRWIAPIPIDDLLREASATGRVLVVDETRRTGGVGEGIVAELVDAGFGGSIRRVASHDSFIPLGAAANLVLVGLDDIVAAALA
jgi:2-oxoisovalerate dehydrogenase E1 component